MTRKDYRLIATEFRIVEPVTPEGCGIKQKLARGLCLALSEDNPRFDRQKFLDACGVSS